MRVTINMIMISIILLLNKMIHTVQTMKANNQCCYLIKNKKNKKEVPILLLY